MSFQSSLLSFLLKPPYDHREHELMTATTRRRRPRSRLSNMTVYNKQSRLQLTTKQERNNNKQQSCLWLFQRLWRSKSRPLRHLTYNHWFHRLLFIDCSGCVLQLLFLIVIVINYFHCYCCCCCCSCCDMVIAVVIVIVIVIVVVIVIVHYSLYVSVCHCHCCYCLLCCHCCYCLLFVLLFVRLLLVLLFAIVCYCLLLCNFHHVSSLSTMNDEQWTTHKHNETMKNTQYCRQCKQWAINKQ